MKNKRFGKLTAKYIHDIYRKIPHWDCKCDCGKWITASETGLRLGIRLACNTCQPIKKMKYAPIGPRQADLKTRVGKSFRSAKRHCTDQNCVNYPNYGARGIQFKFANFKEWEQELGQCPKGYFLDRIDPNGHYEKGNVRWVPRWVSTHNRRKYSKGNPKQHSQFRGVWRNAGKVTKWAALVSKDRKRYYLGTFFSEEDAARAYDKKAIELYGEYAVPNLPSLQTGTELTRCGLEVGPLPLQE